MLDPTGTTFTLVLPYWPEADWWHLTRYFQLVHTYDTGSVIFSAPRRGTYDTDRLPDAGDEGGADRVIIGGTSWPVCVFHKSQHTITQVDSNVLLHMRLCHAGGAATKEIIHRGVKTGLKNLSAKHVCNQKHCTMCMAANMTRPAVYPTDPQDWPLFGLIFSDIHIVSVYSHEGYKYIIHFTDYTSRYARVYFLRTRDEALDAFIEYIAEIGALGFQVTGLCLRTDNAKEYILGKFKAFCDTPGSEILQQTSPPYTHTGNAIAERFWKTLWNKIRASMMTANLDAKYWPLAAAHCEYVYNRTPHTFLDMGFPIEKVTGRAPDLSSLRVFGCTAFAHVDETLRTKQEDRGVAGVYVGHEHNSASVKILIPETGEVKLSGMVDYIEEADTYGRLISDHTPPDTWDSLWEEEESRTARPAGMSEAVSVTKIDRILDHRVYYYSTDKETYGVVLVKKKGKSRPVWMHASALGHTYSDSDGVKKLVKFINSIKLLQDVNPFYPIFSTVRITPHSTRSTDQETRSAMIISSDVQSRHARGSASHGVLFLDGAMEFQDLHGSRVERPHVAAPVTASLPGSEEYTYDYYRSHLDGDTERVRIPTPQDHWSEDIQSSSDGRTYTVDYTAAPASHYHGAVYGDVHMTDHPSSAFYVRDGRVIYTSIAAAIGARPSQQETPTTWKRAQELGENWVECTWDEIQSYIDFGVIEPLDKEDIPKGCNITGSRFVYKLKLKADGSVDKYKARLVIKGFTQVKGLDYEETFAPVSDLMTVRIVLLICLHYGLIPHHVDVKCAFLNSTLKEEVYVRLPEDFGIGGKRYGRLKKSVYGLKQAAHDWFELQHSFLMTYDMVYDETTGEMVSRIQQSASDPCLYYLMDGDLMVIISTHVDDYVIGSSSDQWYQDFVAAFGAAFEITDMGVVSHLLQMSVDWSPDSVKLGQQRQIEELLEKYDLIDFKTV